MSEQPSLFSDADSFDAAKAARHIVEHAPSDPYAEQDARDQAIIESRGEDLGREQTGTPVPSRHLDVRVAAQHADIRKQQERDSQIPGREGREFWQPTPPDATGVEKVVSIKKLLDKSAKRRGK